MTLHTTDKSVLNHIERLVTEEKELYAKSEMSNAQRRRLTTINPQPTASRPRRGRTSSPINGHNARSRSEVAAGFV